MEIYFGNPRYAAQQNVFEAGLGCCRHRDRIAIAAKTSRNPEHIDFGEWWSAAMWMIAGHSAATSLFGSALRCVCSRVNLGFRACPMQAKPHEIGMLSVKKKHSLGGRCDSRRRTR